MFPFAIYNSYVKNIEKIFIDYSKKINLNLKDSLKEESNLYTQTKQDAKDLYELLEEMKKDYGKFVDRKTLEELIAKNYNLIDAWSVSKANQTIKRNFKSKNPDDESDKPRVPLLDPKDKEALSRIELASKNAKLAQNAIYRDHFKSVEEIINSGIISKTPVEEITKQILAKTNMNAKRAKFWAEDQLSTFQTEQTRLRSIKAGYIYYRWKNSKGSRPSHAVHGTKIFSWNVGVNNLTKPGARHPGEDYRCKCTADPITDPKEIAKLNLNPQPPNGPQSVAGLVENYGGSEEFKKEKGKKFLETIGQGVSNLVSNVFGTVTKVKKDVPKFKTTKEAQDWARENDLANVVNYEGLDVEIANAMNQSIYEATTEFPELRKNMEFVGSLQDLFDIQHEILVKAKMNAFKKLQPDLSDDYVRKFIKENYLKEIVPEDAFAASNTRIGLRGITFNKNLSIKEINKLLREGVTDKFRPIGCDTIKSVIDHEVGHMLDNLLTITNDPKIKNTLKEYIYEDALNPIVKYKKLTDDLSRYSWNNDNPDKLREAIAEGYSEYKNNPKVRKLAKIIGDRIKEKYGTQFR